MHNIFIIVRFVFYALLVYLSLVSLIFASWNVHLASSSGKEASGAIKFVIFNSCAILILIGGALLELAWRKARTAIVKYECSWTALFSVFQIAASVSATASSFGLSCQTSGDWGPCASANLVVLSTWLGSIIILAYFLMLFITSVMHMHEYPEIWSTSVYIVQWFPRTSSGHASTSKPEPEPEPSVHPDTEGGGFRDSWGRYWPFRRRDIEANRDSDQQSHQSRQSARPKWSRGLTIRRGVDDPFGRENGAGTIRTADATTKPLSPTGSNLLLPPLEIHSKESLTTRSEGSRYVELFRESTLPAIPTTQNNTLSYYGLGLDETSRVSNPFPLKVDNDRPIPLPRLSEWIRAGDERNVDTPPTISA